MSFTTAEVEGAIAKLVRTEIRRQYGALGNRRTDLTFNDTKNAAAGVFILNLGAPFYVVRLACDREGVEVASTRDAITNLDAAVRATGRRVNPVKSLSSLSNAKVALDGLASATAARSSALGDITEVPAFQRFNKNTQRFLDDTRGALTQSGAVVLTPSNARAQLGTLFTTLKSQHEEVVRRAELLSSAIDDFNELRLSATLSADIIANAQSVLAERIEELTALSAEDRLNIIRDVTLDILAARSSVQGFGSLTGPTQFLSIVGTGAPYADESHPATPAVLSSEYFGPYTIVDDATSGIYLDLVLDGDTAVTITVQLQGSFVASFPGVIKGPYDTTLVGPSGFTNNIFRITVSNWPTFGTSNTIDVTLSTTAALAAYDLAVEINTELQTAVPGLPVLAEVYANPLKFKGSALLDFTLVPDLVVFAPPGTDFTDIDGNGNVFAEEGDWVRVIDTTALNNTAVAAVDPGGVFADRIECTILINPGPGTNETKVVELGEGTMPIQLRVADDAQAVAVDERLTLTLPEAGPSGADRQYEALTNFGLVPLMEAISRGTSTADLAAAITVSSDVTVAGVPRLEALATFVATQFVGFVRSDPFNFLTAVLYVFRGTAHTVSYAAPDTAFTVAGDATTLVALGDILVLREGSSDPDEINAYGIISSAVFDGTNTTFVAEMSPNVSVATGPVEIEIGPDARTFPFDTTLRLDDGTSNSGDYLVLSIGSAPLELTLQAPLPFAVGAGNLPVFMNGEVGQFRLDFISTDTTLATQVTVDEVSYSVTVPSTHSRFFGNDGVPLVQDAFGTTSFFQLPEFPKATEEDDLLELYVNQYNSPLYTRAVTGLEEADRLVELDIPLSTDIGSFSFGEDAPSNFGRVRKHQLNNYELLESDLGVFLVSDVSTTDQYYRELQRLINALLVNAQPTPVQIGAVTQQLGLLTASMDQLEGYLDAYTADAVEQVDTLIASYREKGSERAVDLLLSANFGAFFGVSMDEVSYLGAMQKTLREVERNDLPIRKVDRLNDNAGADAILASYEEPDFEFSQSDLEDIEDVDIPVGSVTDIPGGRD